MKTYHYTHDDSTKSTPHYTITFTTSQGFYIGEYSIMGYYLYNVNLSEDYRGKGLCKTVVNHAVSSKKNLYLDVDADNIPAIKCYKSCGFVFKRVLKNYHHRAWGKNVKPADVLRFKNEIRLKATHL